MPAHQDKSLYIILGDTVSSEIFPLSLHDALPISLAACGSLACDGPNDPSSPALIDAPIAIAFPGGTMLDALNALSRAHQRSEEHTSELQSRLHLVCRHLLDKKKANLSMKNLVKYV